MHGAATASSFGPEELLVAYVETHGLSAEVAAGLRRFQAGFKTVLRRVSPRPIMRHDLAAVAAPCICRHK